MDKKAEIKNLEMVIAELSKRIENGEDADGSLAKMKKEWEEKLAELKSE